ncbi:MAG: PilZ domain-containing protein [Planctomycetota bacterium]
MVPQNSPHAHGQPVERRRFPRFRTNMSLKYRLLDQNSLPLEPTYSFGRVLDISDGGMLMEVDRVLELGQKVEIYTSSKAGSTGIYGVVVAVRVVRAIDLYEIGVRFVIREKL